MDVRYGRLILCTMLFAVGHNGLICCANNHQSVTPFQAPSSNGNDYRYTATSATLIDSISPDNHPDNYTADLENPLTVSSAMATSRRSFEINPEAGPTNGSNLGDLEQYLNLPDSKIDIGYGNLLAGKQYDSEINIEKYLREIDHIANAVRTRIGRERNPEKITAIINDFIFKDFGFVAVEDPYAEDFLIHDLLRSRRGRCMSLVALYISIADRIGFDLAAVCIPEHIWIRWIPRKKIFFAKNRNYFNIETTQNGLSIPDEHYRNQFQNNENLPENSFYLKPLSRRQTLAAYLSALGDALRKQGRLATAQLACQLAVEINPGDAEAWNNLGVIYKRKKMNDMATSSFNRAIEAYPGFAAPVLNLGSIQINNDERIKYYRRVLSLQPEFVDVWINLIALHIQNGNLDMAWACVNRCRSEGHPIPPQLLKELQMRLNSDPANRSLR